LNEPGKTARADFFLRDLPPGRAGVLVTLKLMRQMVKTCKTDPSVRAVALSVTQSVAQRSYMGEVIALHKFVRDKIRYVGDVRGVETLHTPRKILEQRAGDCDDKATLLATLLESIEHPTRFAAIGLTDKLSHVLVETKVRNAWIPLETTEPVPAGWYPDGVKSRLVIYN